MTTVPPTLSQLKHRQRLDLDNNRLSKLYSLENCSELSERLLDSNYLEEWPEGLSSLRKLPYLDLGGNNLEDIPDEILSCQSLEHLLLVNNKISDFPEKMFSMHA